MKISLTRPQTPIPILTPIIIMNIIKLQRIQIISLTSLFCPKVLMKETFRSVKNEQKKTFTAKKKLKNQKKVIKLTKSKPNPKSFSNNNRFQ